MQCADQQLAVFPSVLMFYVVGLNYFFFQHQYHLRSKKQIIEYKLTSFFSSFYSIQRRIIYTGSFLNLIFCHQDLIIILPMLPDFIIFSLYQICQIKSRFDVVLPLQCFWRRQGQEPRSRSFSSLLNLEHSILSKCPSPNPGKEQYNHISFSGHLYISSV